MKNKVRMRRFPATFRRATVKTNRFRDCAGWVACMAILFLMTGALPKPVLADGLTVLGGPPGGNCAQSVSSGKTSVSCGNAVYGDVATASGNLATGTFGATTSNNPVTVDPITGYLEGSSSTAFVTIAYNFAVSGVQSGTADFGLSMTGLLSQSSTGCTDTNGCPVPYAYLGFSNSETLITGGVVQPQALYQLSSGTTDFIVASSITNGVAQLYLTLQASADCNGAFTSCSATADFLDPATITGATVYDSNGTLVSGASLVSDSGFNPNAGPVATPEPSSFLLLGAALLGLICTTKLRAFKA